MLDQFQVRDLPMFDVVLALETASLKAVHAALEPSDCRGVLVLAADGTPRGLVMRDSVLRHAGRLSDMRVGLLPALTVVEVSPDAMLQDAAKAASAAGVGAIVSRCDETCDPRVMLRDEMLNVTDWSPLVDARAARQVIAMPHRTLTPPPVIAL